MGGNLDFWNLPKKSYITLSALFTYASGLSLISGCCGEASLFTPCGYHLPQKVGPFLFFPLEVVTLVAAVVVTFRCFVTKAKPTFPISFVPGISGGVEPEEEAASRGPRKVEVGS